MIQQLGDILLLIIAALWIGIMAWIITTMIKGILANTPKDKK